MAPPPWSQRPWNPISTPPPLLWSPAPVHLLVMLLEGLLDFGDLKSQQMRSGSVTPSPPQQTLHLYDPVPLLLRQQSPWSSSLALNSLWQRQAILLPASTPPWAGMTGLCCLALLLNKILLTTSFSMGNQVQLFLAASQALPAPLPTSPLSSAHTGLLPAGRPPPPGHSYCHWGGLPRRRCCLAGPSSRRGH